VRRRNVDCDGVRSKDLNAGIGRQPTRFHGHQHNQNGSNTKPRMKQLSRYPTSHFLFFFPLPRPTANLTGIPSQGVLHKLGLSRVISHPMYTRHHKHPRHDDRNSRPCSAVRNSINSSTDVPLSSLPFSQTSSALSTTLVPSRYVLALLSVRVCVGRKWERQRGAATHPLPAK
jgi:hypothetical protein